MSILDRLFNRDPYPTVTQYRRYLAGVPQARPYVLSTVRVVEAPSDLGHHQEMVQGYLAAQRRDLVERSRNAPIVGVTIEGRYGHDSQG